MNRSTTFQKTSDHFRQPGELFLVNNKNPSRLRACGSRFEKANDDSTQQFLSVFFSYWSLKHFHWLLFSFHFNLIIFFPRQNRCEDKITKLSNLQALDRRSQIFSVRSWLPLTTIEGSPIKRAANTLPLCPVKVCCKFKEKGKKNTENGLIRLLR